MFPLTFFRVLSSPTQQHSTEIMAVLVHGVLLLAGLVQASQVVLSSKPTTGNVAYTLSTERTFLLNVPAAYTHGEPHPLVLSFHGGESRFICTYGKMKKKIKEQPSLFIPSLKASC